MKKYKDSFEVQSESLGEGGRGILTAVDNRDPSVLTRERHTDFAQGGSPGPSVPLVRTLTSDAQDVVERNSVSLSGEALALKERRRIMRAPRRGARANARGARPFPVLTTLVVGALLIFAGSLIFFMSRQNMPLDGIFGVFQLPPLPTFGTPPAEAPREEEVPSRSLFTADEEKEIAVDGGTDRLRFRAIVEEKILAAPQGSVVALIPVETRQREGGAVQETLSSFRLFNILNLPVYETLSRNIDAYTLGVIGEEEASMFFVARIRFSDDVLAAMLSWERTILRDLYMLFHSDVRLALDRGGAVFRDVVVLGSDARVLTQPNETPVEGRGETGAEERDIIAYTIVNNEMLLIAPSRELLSDIISRLK